MTDTLKEQLSAFLDGELPEAETTLLLKRLERDDDLKGTLSRYSLIGSMLRAEGDVSAAHHVAARVSAAIQMEPTLRHGAIAGSRWLKPAAGLAVAAGVAAATVVLLPLWAGGGVMPDAGGVAATASTGAPVTVASLAPESEIVPVSIATDEPDPAYTTPPAPAGGANLPPAQLASYLVAHSVYNSPLSARNMVTAVVVDTPEPEAQEADKPATAASGR